MPEFYQIEMTKFLIKAPDETIMIHKVREYFLVVKA